MPLCPWVRAQLVFLVLCSELLSCGRCDSSTWRCPADCSGDSLIFIFKENSVTVAAGRPLGTPGNMILSQEQRGEFVEDQMRRNREEEAKPRVQTVMGPAPFAEI